MADGVPPEQTPPRGALVRIRLARDRQRKEGRDNREPANHGYTTRSNCPGCYITPGYSTI
ncbi:MAG: hypothetical protein MZV63_20960 [Marinilabiliales bacterium]|nr:hypothetical protein [Marinilabiliales bacterium]